MRITLQRDWEPGGFPQSITLMAKVTLLAMMLVRGMDLVAGDAPTTARRLGTVEAAMPLQFWGMAFLIGACAGFIGMAWRIGALILGAHVAGWVIYWGYAVGVITDVLQRRFPHPPPHAGHDASWAMWELVIPLATLAAVVVAWMRGKWEHSCLITGCFIVTVIAALSSVELDGLRNASVLIGVGAMHLIMAVGTISRLRQDEIRKELDDGSGPAV